MTLGTWLLVALLGGIGSLARFLVDGLVGEWSPAVAFPWGTFAVNISGAALLGVLAGAAVSGRAELLAGTATLGSYTTFSTWMLETDRLAEGHKPVVATVNVAASLVLGFAAVALGHALGAAL